MYADFRQDGWPLCPLCKADALHSVYESIQWPIQGEKPTVAQCMRDVMRCEACGWASNSPLRNTMLGHPYIVKSDVWPPRMVLPNDPTNKSGSIEIHGISFQPVYSAYWDTLVVPIPLGPQIADADLFV